MSPGTALDILVVDDDAPLRDMLTRSFEREGHRITAVADGHAALDEVGRAQFDVILLDVALGPGPTGYDVARALRARRNVTPGIMLTALDSEADAVQGLEAGGDDYVTKPFGLAELRSRIREVQRRARGSRQTSAPTATACSTPGSSRSPTSCSTSASARSRSTPARYASRSPSS